MKQFLHVTRAPPALIHPNVFRILMGCSVLNFLYQLDILLVEICFVYTLKLGTDGKLSMYEGGCPGQGPMVRDVPRLVSVWLKIMLR